MSKKIGETLTMYRKKLDLTQREVAEALNVDRSTYTCYEIGKTEPNIETLTKLAKIFNVSIIDLFPSSDENDAQAADFESSDDIQIKRSKFYELSGYEKMLIMKVRKMPIEKRIALRNFIEDELQE